MRLLFPGQMQSDGVIGLEGDAGFDTSALGTLRAATSSQQNWRRGCMCLQLAWSTLDQKLVQGAAGSWPVGVWRCLQDIHWFCKFHHFSICSPACGSNPGTVPSFWLPYKAMSNRSICAWTYFLRKFQTLTGAKAANLTQKLWGSKVHELDDSASASNDQQRNKHRLLSLQISRMASRLQDSPKYRARRPDETGVGKPQRFKFKRALRHSHLKNNICVLTLIPFTFDDIYIYIYIIYIHI